VKIIIVLVVSWGAGLAAYLGSLALLYRQSISFWSILAFAVVFSVLYLPALISMIRWLRGVRPMWPFPLLAVLVGVASTAAISLVFSGGDVRSLASPEASLFFSMFGAVGIVVGCGYTFVYRHDQNGWSKLLAVGCSAA
jgi:hypothetical protein